MVVLRGVQDNVRRLPKKTPGCSRSPCASTAHANTPPCDLLYHDGRAHRLDKRLLIWLSPSPRRGAHSSGTSANANLKTGDGLVAAEREGVKYVRTSANDTTVDNLLQGQGPLAAGAWEED
jgi:hypothetical protein